MTDHEGWGDWESGPPREITEYEKTYVARRQAKPKRPGATPEAKVLKACIAYLESLDCYTLRSSSGFTNFGERAVTMGRAGLPDILCCKAGRFIAVECKAQGGKVSEAQARQHEFIKRRGGIVIIPHSVAELRAGLVEAFGAQTVADWEKLGKQR